MIYADDIILISIVTLQKLLDICSDYGNKRKIKFNQLKSNIINFGEQLLLSSKLYLNNEAIKRTGRFSYLEAEIRNDLDLDDV